jgi:ribosomal protein L11 methylase PrmA
MARIEGSFRDDWGQVHDVDGRILRSVSPTARPEFEAVEATGFFREAQAKGLLIAADRVPPESVPEELREAALVLEHPRIPVVSYPYEWSFGQLQAAALLHLELQILALSRGVVLRDATAYNVQFVGPSPVFIDFLSFRPYRPGEFWMGHQQFVSQFLVPLLLESRCGVPFQASYRGHLEGIPVTEAADLLPLSSWRTPTIVLDVLLPARFQRRKRDDDAGSLSSITKRELPTSAYRAMLERLHAFLGRLAPAGVRTTWSDYRSTNTYRSEEVERKSAFLGAFVEATRPGLLLDLGCNTGMYSETALNAGATRAVGFDIDPAAVDGAWREAARKRLDLLPLVQDLANPSPAQGWNLRERPPLADRVRPDAVIALALEHHLLIGRHIPTASFFSWLLSWAPRGVVEFVQKEDSTVQRMLALRDGDFSWYSEEEFRRHLEQEARIVRSEVITAEGRTLFWYERDARPA